MNPWGVSFANGSPVWISDQGTQTAPLFAVTGSTDVGNAPLFTVNIPPAGASGPTGQVANAMGMGFDVGNGGNGKSATFIFANLNGSIAAWNGAPQTQAFTQTTVAGASFTGLAINQTDTELFAANTAGAGGIDVFNNAFQQITEPLGAFATPTAAAGLVPFNVTDLGGNVFVTYAPSGHVPRRRRPRRARAPSRNSPRAAYSRRRSLTTLSPRRGASPSLRRASASSVATFWSAISASSPAWPT